ncbi:M20/M25/M40 family metallo-hydrolase [Flavisphingomonas formosensis]|uniref:M20/M25/M40 family metallo-hydrolase n=1 Tax=Flavisphingomonas formosensis TaxID=861534 RepID=UPI0012FA983C|nr:M20/M25/M40 family metallo-hydrolase [Sphingomonas formosensis]
MRPVLSFMALSAMLSATPAAAAPRPDPAAAAQALDILKRSVAFRTQEGAGQVPAYAAWLKSVLVEGGFPADSIVFTPLGETGSLTMTWKGSDPSKKPLVYSGHMDVVAADPKDWQRDPYTPVIEGKYLYGRGAEDDKFDTSVAIAALIQLRKAGFRPSRTIVMALSGDEETEMATTAALAEKLKGAELVLNGDGGGGTYSEDGKPQVYSLEGAEKTYADFEFSVTNPGGHSSRPVKDNAIYELAKIIDRIAAYQFPPQQNEFTKAYFAMTGARTAGPLGDAMKRFAADVNDREAADLLSNEAEYVGRVRTTCVATMLKGGHALNALPQKASLSVNCRIFPGTKVEDVQAKLTEVAADPKMTVTLLNKPVASPPSPMRKDVMDAVRHAIDARYPGLPIIPSQASGASDNMYYRRVGIPSYALGALFMKPSDERAHGLDERVLVSEVPAGVQYWVSMFDELAK